jgi:hypothetical protein
MLLPLTQIVAIRWLGGPDALRDRESRVPLRWS